MKFLFKSKDGGSESTVTGFWLIEAKSWFSVVLLVFDGESREAYHTHAFNAISWVIRGGLTEKLWKGKSVRYPASFIPIRTAREVCHKVKSDKGKTYVLSFRGPWSDTWVEYRPLEGNRRVTLTHGRVEI
jgi:hypothetical protein